MEIRLATLNDIEQIRLLNHEFWVYNARLQPEYYKDAEESGAYPKSVISYVIRSDKLYGIIELFLTDGYNEELS